MAGSSKSKTSEFPSSLLSRALLVMRTPVGTPPPRQPHTAGGTAFCFLLGGGGMGCPMRRQSGWGHCRDPQPHVASPGHTHPTSLPSFPRVLSSCSTFTIQAWDRNTQRFQLCLPLASTGEGAQTLRTNHVSTTSYVVLGLPTRDRTTEQARVGGAAGVVEAVAGTEGGRSHC